MSAISSSSSPNEEPNHRVQAAKIHEMLALIALNLDNLKNAESEYKEALRIYELLNDENVVKIQNYLTQLKERLSEPSTSGA